MVITFVPFGWVFATTVSEFGTGCGCNGVTTYLLLKGSIFLVLLQCFRCSNFVSSAVRVEHGSWVCRCGGSIAANSVMLAPMLTVD